MGGSSSTESSLLLSPASVLEKQARGQVSGNLTDLTSLVGAGANQSDVTAGLQSSRGLADLLQQYTQSGGQPNQQDIASAQSLSQDVFAPERNAVQQNFSEQQQRTAQLSARLGRPANDPILQAKLAQEQTRQLSDVQARQTQFRAQQAQSMPLQRLQFQSQLADVRGGLASQAFQNRTALLSLGQQIQQGERDFRVKTATTRQTQNSNPGLMSTIGAVAGVGGALFGAGGSFPGAFGLGSGGGGDATQNFDKFGMGGGNNGYGVR